MNKDAIIVGQGLCGTFLSWYLEQMGWDILVIDEDLPHTASKVASGIINPVTGRRVVRTWLIEEMLEFSQAAYADLGRDLGEEIAKTIPVNTFFTTDQMAAAWHDRICEGEEYIQWATNTDELAKYFNVYRQVGITYPCLLVDINLMMQAWRLRLAKNGKLLSRKFDIANCSITEEKVVYEDITAGKIIFCNGVNAFDNIFFHKLPYALIKGEAIIAGIPGLPATSIYKQGMSIVPYGSDLFWIGSSFEWDYENERPTQKFYTDVQELLNTWLKLPYCVVSHSAAVRPGSLERRPFVGLHPVYKNVGILGGTGTKGCSLAPYFGYQLAKHLTEGSPIHPGADVSRFGKLLR